MIHHGRKLLVVAAVAAAVAASPARANFIESLGVGARASALGSAFIGVADSPAAIYYNPAGLTQMLGDGRPTDQSLGVKIVNISYNVRQPVASAESGLNAGGQVNSSFDDLFYQPDFPGGLELTDSIYVAPFAFTAPFGGFLRFPEDKGDQRFSSYEAAELFVNFSPRIAIKLTDWLSIGGGPDVQAFNQIKRKSRLGDGFAIGNAAQFLGTTEAEAERLLGLVGVRSNGLDDGKIGIESDDEVPTGLRPVNEMNSNWEDVGFTVGLHLQPTDWLRIGAVYRSEIRAHIEGTAKAILFDDPVVDFFNELAASPIGPILGVDPIHDDAERFKLVFPLPAQIGGGVAIDVTDWLMLTGDVVWTDWQHARREDTVWFGGDGLGPGVFLDGTAADPSTAPKLGIKVAKIKRRFKSTLSWRGGVEIKLTDHIRTQFGYWYDPDPQSDKYYAFDDGVDDRIYYSAGIGAYGLFDGLLDFNLAYQFIEFKRRRINIGESMNLGGTKFFVDPFSDGQADNTDFALSVGGQVQAFSIDATLHF
ncbi:MAG: outer membrane protein transport protein [Candidatus Methylomirabilis sp.]|nr:outer membrane protein transport protein [Deltaproteobacteria bacterium]